MVVTSCSWTPSVDVVLWQEPCIVEEHQCVCVGERECTCVCMCVGGFSAQGREGVGGRGIHYLYSVWLFEQ